MKGRKKAKKQGTGNGNGKVAKMAKAAKSGKVEKVGRKEYEKRLRKLHEELVQIQLWVQQKGLKVCILFEGRDGAGKGGTIKALTERVSPRVFRVVALPAPTEREKSQMYIAALHAASARGGRDRDLRPQLVQPGGRRARHGLLQCGAGGEQFLNMAPAVREDGDHAFRRDPPQVLARGEPRRADATPAGAHQRRTQDLEALAHGPAFVQPLVRLLARPRRHVRRNRHTPGRRGSSCAPTTRSARGST